jgi:hypothetical protein
MGSRGEAVGGAASRPVRLRSRWRKLTVMGGNTVDDEMMRMRIQVDEGGMG